MREKLNCPNCGAPITNAICEYCGTLFYDFANIEVGKPAYLRMKIGDTLHIFKAVTENIRIEVNDASPTYYYNNQPVAICATPDYGVNLKLRVVPDDRGVLVTKLSEKFRRK